MTSVSSPFIILACIVCIVASSASTHSNLRGQNILDLVDLDLDNLPCYLRNDPRPNHQCAQQNKICGEGEHCFVISVGGGAIYRCYEPCSNTTDTSNTTTTTTSTTSTTPVCIKGGYNGCNPSPFVQPNCCPGSHCTGDDSNVKDRHYTSYKCVDMSELGGGELVE